MVIEGLLRVLISRFGEKLLDSRCRFLGNAEWGVGVGFGGEPGKEKSECSCPVTSLLTSWFCVFMTASSLMYSAPGFLGLRLVFNFGLRKYSQSHD